MNSEASSQSSLDRIFASPSLSGPAPRLLRFSPDGRRVTMLRPSPDDHHVLDLWELDLESETARLLVAARALAAVDEASASELARRERKRISESGIVDYVWSPASDAIAFPMSGRIFLVRLGARAGEHRVVALTQGARDLSDLQFSPGGRYLSFTAVGDLCAIELASGREFILGSAAALGGSCGVAEFIAQEEMGRTSGAWWSPNERHLAFAVVDESAVDELERIDVHGGKIVTVKQRYPRAGTTNAKVRLAILELDEAGEPAGTTWADLGPKDEAHYLARVTWHPSSLALYVQTQNRRQSRLELRTVDPKSGAGTSLFTERDPIWINLNDDLRFVDDGQRMIWASEQTGFKHLYLLDAKSGQRLSAITNGDWAVHQLKAVDAAQGLVYFEAFKESPCELHLYVASWRTLDESPRRLTADGGWHETALNRDSSHFIDRHASQAMPPRTSLRRIDGSHVAWIEKNEVNAAHPGAAALLRFQAMQLGRLTADDGTPLHYRLIEPRGAGRTSQKFPLLVYCYGGPRAQLVTDNWGGERQFWLQHLADCGIAVLTVDNRGSTHRGKAFEAPIKGRLGVVEVADQAAAVRMASALPYIDPERIGIFGWSYGGYLSLMCMLERPDLFKVGVAVAPVTDWTLYDTHYTERYLGLPEENPEGYRQSAVLPRAHQLQGKLLLVHGMADDNVFYTHSLALYLALQQAGKSFDIMAYPGQKHGIYEKSARLHVHRAIAAYFLEHLR